MAQERVWKFRRKTALLCGDSHLSAGTTQKTDYHLYFFGSFESHLITPRARSVARGSDSLLLAIVCKDSTAALSILHEAYASSVRLHDQPKYCLDKLVIIVYFLSYTWPIITNSFKGEARRR